MLVIAAMPYLPLCKGARRKRISAFDELNTFRKSLIVARREKQMNMVWHDGEAVELEFVLFPISDKCL